MTLQQQQQSRRKSKNLRVLRLSKTMMRMQSLFTMKRKMLISAIILITSLLSIMKSYIIIA